MKKLILLSCTAILLASCGGEEDATNYESGQASTDAVEQTSGTGPLGPDPTPEEIEAQRFDENWRQSDSFANRRRSGEPRSGQFADTAAKLDFERRSDSVEDPYLPGGRSGSGFDTLFVPIEGDVSGRSVLAAQVLLARANFSPGVIDGRWGKNSSTATWWFQDQYGIEPTGTVDEATFRKLVEVAGASSPLQRYNVTTADVETELTDIPDDPYEKAELDCLCYETIGEALAEKFQTTPEFLETINEINLESVSEGDQLWVPNVGGPGKPDIQRVVVSVEGRYLHGEDGSSNITFHAPVTVGSEYDPSPSETLEVVGIAHDPTFHYQPKLYHEVPDDEEDVIMQPGPNSPVGVVWMALSKDNYGIHGTAAPSTIGYTSSHGCIRLTNWDAKRLAETISNGTTVEFTDARR